MHDNKKSNNKKLLNTSLDAFDERLRALEDSVSDIEKALQGRVTHKDLQNLRNDMREHFKTVVWIMMLGMAGFAALIITAFANLA